MTADRMKRIGELVLGHPTVAELIAALSAYPPDMKVTILDTDTWWTITQIHIATYPDEVQLFGCFGEMKH